MLVSVGMRPFVRHTAAMRYLHGPTLRQASAALAATACLVLAACGAGGGSHHPSAKSPSPKPTASATAAEPASGPAAVAAITANWKTVFDGEASIPRRLALVQDGPEVAAFVEAQAKTSLGKAAAGSTATVSSVTITSPSQATVDYEVLLLGTPLLKNQAGIAVYTDGVWKVGIASFCGLAYLEYPKTSPDLPAVCRS
jgi:glucose/arabinose dehydrogenase